MAELTKMVMTVIERIKSNPSIAKENKKHLDDLIVYLQAKNMKPNTIEKYVYHYEKILHAIGEKKDILKADKKDIEKAIANINTLKLVDEEKRKIKVTIKVLYKHFLGEDEYYPRQIAWIRTSASKNKVLPEDLLSEEEVMKLINAARDVRDKAIIALLFDTGVRIGELIGLRKKDVDVSSQPAHITVNGKTGMRKIPIMFSVPYLVQYLEVIKDTDRNDSLWLAIGTWSNTGKSIDDNGIRLMLKRLEKRAKIGKRLYPHLFRHSRASYYANKLTEQQLKHFFGWTGDSKMAATYVHLSGRDIDNAVMQVYGQKRDEEPARPKLSIQVCPRCRFENSATAGFCTRCGSALDIATAVKQGEMEERARKLAAKSFEQPEINKDVVEKIKRRKKQNDTG
jgi:site-specific recombinase XerD